jgi:hypothetical protein
MAKEYFDKLSSLVATLDMENEIPAPMEVKHFFSGAALYINKILCVSWSPVGLAFKLPAKDVKKLISSGNAIPLKYFPKGHVKKGYALFEDPDSKKPSYWKRYFKLSADQV